MPDTVIKVENLSKQYRLGEVGTGTISHDLNRWWAKVRGKEDPFSKVGEVNDRTQKGDSDYVWALKDINFEVKQGEVLGIIGRNGAGKSTLLKILSKVTQPTAGSVKIKGRIASLLEVGTGFHPELTGRENIFLNGAILGMTKKEVKSKFDEIVDFAGVERYIDTPVKRYSSGMYVRLAFAVAAHLEPEILIVDEVLAVGDAEFQKKCLGKMDEVSKKDGRTILFVSHNLAAILTLTQNSLLLSQGLIVKSGSTSHVMTEYLAEKNSNTDFLNKRKTANLFRRENIEGVDVIIADIYIEGFEDVIPELKLSEDVDILIKIISKYKIDNCVITCFIKNFSGEKVCVFSSWDKNFSFSLAEGENNISMKLISPNLASGNYYLDLGLNDLVSAKSIDVVVDYPIFKYNIENQFLYWKHRPQGIIYLNRVNWGIK